MAVRVAVRLVMAVVMGVLRSVAVEMHAHILLVHSAPRTHAEPPLN